jgi:hypothetical protein
MSEIKRKFNRRGSKFASRRAAQNSTGPRTAEGKARSAQNAVLHGFTSRTPFLLPNERQDAWAVHLNHYSAHLRPADIVECDLVKDLAWARWRLNRYSAVEAGVLTLRMADQQNLHDPDWTPPPGSSIHPEYLRISRAVLAESGPNGAMELLSRYHARINRDYHRALSTLRSIRQNPIPIPDFPVVILDPTAAPATHQRPDREGGLGNNAAAPDPAVGLGVNNAAPNLGPDPAVRPGVNTAGDLSPELARSEAMGPDSAADDPTSHPNAAPGDSDSCLLTPNFPPATPPPPAKPQPTVTILPAPNPLHSKMPNELPSHPKSPKDLTNDEIERHPHFRRFMNLVHRTLQDNFPDALQAVYTAIDELNEEEKNGPRAA